MLWFYQVWAAAVDNLKHLAVMINKTLPNKVDAFDEAKTAWVNEFKHLKAQSTLHLPPEKANEVALASMKLMTEVRPFKRTFDCQIFLTWIVVTLAFSCRHLSA